MTPALRRALHQCVDILCDALAEDAEEKPSRGKRLRPYARPPAALPEGVTQEEVSDVRKRLERAGFRHTG